MTRGSPAIHPIEQSKIETSPHSKAVFENQIQFACNLFFILWVGDWADKASPLIDQRSLCICGNAQPPPPSLPSPSSVVCFPAGPSIFVCFLPPLLFWRSPSALCLSLTHPSSLARPLARSRSNYTWRVAPVPRLPALTPWCVEARVFPCAFLSVCSRASRWLRSLVQVCCFLDALVFCFCSYSYYSSSFFFLSLFKKGVVVALLR